MPAARWPAALGVGLDQPPEGAGERGLHEQVAHLGHPAARVEHGAAAGRIDVELAPRLRDGEHAVHVLVHREAALSAVHGRGEHLAHGLRPVGLEQGQVGVDGPRDRERQMGVRPRPGRDAIEPLAAHEGERGEGGRHALTAQGVGLPSPRVVDERDALAAQRVGRGRFHHGGGEAGGHRGVEGVAAREQHAHARHRHQGVARGDDTLGARDHGPGRRPVGGVVLHLVDARELVGHEPSPSEAPILAQATARVKVGRLRRAGPAGVGSDGLVVDERALSSNAGRAGRAASADLDREGTGQGVTGSPGPPIAGGPHRRRPSVTGSTPNPVPDQVRDELQLPVGLGVLRIPAAVEANRRAHDPFLQVKAEEPAALGIPAEDETIPGRRETEILDQVLVLVRPEGMQIVVGLRAAHHRPGRGPPLLIAVVPVLDAEAAEERMQMVGHVARGIDIGERGPAVRVDEHPVVDGRSRGGQQLTVGRDADAGHHQVALEHPPLPRAHAFHATAAFERGHRILEHQLHPLLAMDAGQDRADLGAEDPRQRPPLALDGGDLEPELAQRCRDLGADEAEADHHGPAPRQGRGAYPVAVLDRAQLEDAVEVRAGATERTVASSRGHQQPVVRHFLAVVQPDDSPPGIDEGCASPEPDGDACWA